MRKILMLSAVVVCGCSAGYTPIVDVEMSTVVAMPLDRALERCGEYAGQVSLVDNVGVEVLDGAISGAAIGGVAGAVLTAPIASAGAGPGAGLGAAAGAGTGIGHGFRAYRAERALVMRNCLGNRGWKVLN